MSVREYEILNIMLMIKTSMKEILDLGKRSKDIACYINYLINQNQNNMNIFMNIYKCLIKGSN